MTISLNEAASILDKTEDEVMFLVQQNKIQAHVSMEPLAWTFELNEVLELKKELEEESQ